MPEKPLEMQVLNRDPMEIALQQAAEAGQNGEVPVGAVIIRNGIVLASSANQPRLLKDPTAHAEILAIRQACRTIDNERLTDCDLYVTLEPCAMCAAAISFARIRRLYFGAYDPKGGAVDHGPCFFQQSTCTHSPEVYGGLAEQDCARLLRDFFQEKRD